MDLHTMHPIEVDLVVRFIPPMEEYAGGIRLTRRFELPFPPFEGFCLTGQSFNSTPTAMGFKLENVTWDIDRELFMADTAIYEHGLPMAFMIQEIRGWLDRGWRLGSYEDFYESQAAKMESEFVQSQFDVDEEELIEKWPSMSPRSRPAEFNEQLKGIVRAMVQANNNLPVAYAIDRTKMFFEKSPKLELSHNERKFSDAQGEYWKMTDDQKFKWQDKVLRRYPTLDALAGRV